MESYDIALKIAKLLDSKKVKKEFSGTNTSDTYLLCKACVLKE